jgi:hypothetical protein
MDRYIGQVLKNWAARQQPPKSARARLLLVASAHAYPLEEPANYYFNENPAHSNDPYGLHGMQPSRNFDLIWAFHLPMPALRMV